MQRTRSRRPAGSITTLLPAWPMQPVHVLGEQHLAPTAGLGDIANRSRNRQLGELGSTSGRPAAGYVPSEIGALDCPLGSKDKRRVPWLTRLAKAAVHCR